MVSNHAFGYFLFNVVNLELTIFILSQSLIESINREFVGFCPIEDFMRVTQYNSLISSVSLSFYKFERNVAC